MPTVTKTSPLELIHGFVYGNTALTRRWSTDDPEKPQGLRVTPHGQARLACAFGFILGMATAGAAAEAEAHADSLCSQLDYLASYGGAEEHGSRKVPRYIVHLMDDGSLHGFKLVWFKYTPEGTEDIEAIKAKTPARVVTEWLLGEQINYLYAFSGGLLYHGAGDNSFSVSLNSTLWSIHT